ncbi:MAG: metal-dependent hydrolase [Truepera sp.]|nr:metal-dependent hydrolase [Truepera sp.]
MKVRFLGHAGVQLVAGGHEFVFDPFVSNNPSAGVELAELNPDVVFVTHAHGDHWGDTPELAQRTGALVVGTAEIADYAANLGLESHGMNIGGSHEFAFGRVSLTQAWHSSSFPDGTYGGMPTGVVLEVADKRVYHAGDTSLFSDMSLLAARQLDLAFLPIGDNYTMGPTAALEAVKLVKPRLVIPIHYDTFPLLKQDAQAFKLAVEESTSTSCLVLAPGEEVTL